MRLKILSIILYFCFIGATQNIIAQEESPKDKTKKTFFKKKEAKTKNQEKVQTPINKIELKNGPSFEGKIIAQTPDSITIRLKSFAQLTFHRNSIENISEVESSSLPKRSRKYYYIMDVAYTFGKYESDSYSFGTAQLSPYYRYTNGFSIQYIFGRKIKPYLGTEAAIGLMNYRDAKFIALHFGIRGDLLAQKKATPYYYGGVGYGYMIQKNISYYLTPDSKGGLFYNYGIGIKLKGNKINLLVGLGQQSQFMRWHEQISNGSYQLKANWYNRFAIKLGVQF